MRALSASTSVFDPYRAGVALGEALAPIAPEVVVLFSSTRYSVAEVLEGVYDGLERDEVIVVGNSGNGVYSTAGALDHGAAALGLNSDGQVRWALEHLEGLNSDLDAKFEQLMARLSSGGAHPDFGLLVSDFRVDAGQIETLLGRWAPFPVVGGLATDNRQRSDCFLYVGRQVISDGLFVLAAYGDLRYSIGLGNSPQTIGHAGVVEQAQGTQLFRVDGVSATDFIARETGKPVLQSDQGILSLLVRDPQAPAEKRLRTIVRDSPLHPGSLGLFGAIAEGHTLQLCVNRPDDMVREVRALVEAASACARPIAAALVISCSGRKFVLGPQLGNEVSALTQVFASDLPLAGFLSAGEIGPQRSELAYTRNLFHNMTYVLLLIEQ